MRRTLLASLVAAPLLALGWLGPVHADNAPAAAPTTCTDGTTSNATGRGACSSHGGVATAKCKDGTYSNSKSHSGACSHHGGVDQWLGSPQ
jgi:hypothetical protein